MEDAGRPVATANQTGSSAYIHALRWAALDALYDGLLALTMPEGELRAALMTELDGRPGEEVLEIGCGTGSQAVRLARAGLRVSGIDGDAMVLARARRKLSRAGLAADLRLGLAEALPFPDHRFDAAVSVLVFHHLPREAKPQALAEAKRVLKPGGRLAILDFGRPRGSWSRLVAPLMRAFDGRANTEDNWAGRIPDLILAAGFVGIHEGWRRETAFGTLQVWGGWKR